MKSFILSVLISTSAIMSVFAQSAENRKQNFLVTKGVALSGYDPVSYQSKNPQKGKASLSVNQNGIEYRFMNTENLEMFKKDPARYEPMYGGWCAYAMGKSGEKVEVDPENYKLINGKLYLFYKSFLNNTLNSWNDDEPHLKKQADINWTKTIGKTN